MNEFTFIDLFSGIGGFHLALYNLGGSCVYACEIDQWARKTYEVNFKPISADLFESNMFREDIRKEENQTVIPIDADILCAGFPCQAFSHAGHQKGFADRRGMLFFELIKVIKNKQPKVIFLENVRYLLKHDNGKTFKIITNTLENEANYSIHYKVMKACDYGLPTYRPRIYIVGFRKDLGIQNFVFPESIPLILSMSDIFGGKCAKKIGYTLRVSGRGSGINDRHNWDAYIVDNKERQITFEEAKKMMGFPYWFTFPTSAPEALRLLGNSVAIDPVRMIAEKIIERLYDTKT